MIKFALAAAVCMMATIGAIAKTLHVGVNHPYATIPQASAIAKAGDTILCHDASIKGGLSISNTNGSSTNFIYLLAEPNKTITIQGGSNSIQFSDCSYLHIEGFVIQGQTGNGMNIDDAGSLETPTHHIHIVRCTFQNINATGNNDLLKLSGLDYFEIIQCIFLNGSAGGSGIDMVGCHYGLIANNSFENQGSNSIQAKGGCFEIDILRNYFKNGGSRALNLGGSTDLQFFRPQNATTEAERINVIANVIEGSEAPIAYVGCTQIKVSNNTILFPKKWVLRILQETVDPTRFLPCGNNSFFNNIVVVDNAVATEVNIGPNTAPETFTFKNNLWFKTTNANWVGPNLPGNISNQKIINPQIIVGTLYKLNANSPAIGFGLPYEKDVLDITGNLFNMPPSVGAFEANPKTSGLQEWSSQQFSLYPNPAIDILHLDFIQEGHRIIKVFDIYGKQVISNEFYEQKNSINITELKPSPYLLLVEYASTKSCRLFIKH